MTPDTCFSPPKVSEHSPKTGSELLGNIVTPCRAPFRIGDLQVLIRRRRSVSLADRCSVSPHGFLLSVHLVGTPLPSSGDDGSGTCGHSAG